MYAPGQVSERLEIPPSTLRRDVKDCCVVQSCGLCIRSYKVIT